MYSQFMMHGQENIKLYIPTLRSYLFLPMIRTSFVCVCVCLFVLSYSPCTDICDHTVGASPSISLYLPSWDLGWGFA